jgi:hypothetical protein
MAINYHPAGLGDWTHSVMTFAQEFEAIGQEAQNIVSSLGDHFDTVQGSVSHNEAQQMIMSGIEEGRGIFIRHADAVDTAATEFTGFDSHAASTFGSI